MTAERKRSHADEIALSLGDRGAAERFSAACAFLLQHLVLKREIPNGRDFLFSGPERDLQEALHELVGVEQKASRFFQFDVVRIDEYFLLRVVASAEHQETIDGYFG